MKTVAIIAGGKSPEHDVSVISARNIYNALDTTLFKIVVIGIARCGTWYHLPDKALFADGLSIGNDEGHQLLTLIPFHPQPIRLAADVSQAIEVVIFFRLRMGCMAKMDFCRGCWSIWIAPT